MIESVERLKKFVDDWYGGDSSIISRSHTGSMITISDIKELLSLIPPYVPGEEIEVSDFDNFSDAGKGLFIGFMPSTKKVVVWWKNEIACWPYHRPLPKTVDLKGFPVDKVELAEKMLGYHYVAYTPETQSILEAIVTSARKE